MVHQTPLTAEEKERLYKALVSLSTSDRAEFVNRLLKESGLGVGIIGGTNTFVGSNVNFNDVLIQINSLPDQQQLELIKEIVDKFKHKVDPD